MFTGEYWFVNVALKDVTPKDIETMINWNIDLVPAIRAKYASLIPLARLAAKRLYDQNRGIPITTENIMRWLEIRRPDLYWTIITRPGGTEWIAKQIEPIKNLLLG